MGLGAQVFVMRGGLADNCHTIKGRDECLLDAAAVYVIANHLVVVVDSGDHGAAVSGVGIAEVDKVTMLVNEAMFHAVGVLVVSRDLAAVVDGGGECADVGIERIAAGGIWITEKVGHLSIAVDDEELGRIIRTGGIIAEVITNNTAAIIDSNDIAAAGLADSDDAKVVGYQRSPRCRHASGYPDGKIQRPHLNCLFRPPFQRMWRRSAGLRVGR